MSAPRNLRPARSPVLPGFEAIHAFWDEAQKVWTTQVLPGDYYVTKADEVITTVLGSCVSACMRDPSARVGGINHFMLPMAPRDSDHEASARYGCYALERLLNALYKHGAARERIEVKIFGGGRVIPGLSDIGQGNISFVRQFLTEEGLHVRAEDVGDTCARRLRYHPATGRASVKRLPLHENAKIASTEQQLQRSVQRKVQGPGDVELF